MHVGLIGLLLVGAALFAGAIVQGSIGFGAVVVAFSVIVLVEPSLLPQSVILAAVPMTILVVVTNRANIVWRDVSVLAASRLPGVALGAVLVGLLSPTTLALIGAGFVLVAVLVTAQAPVVPRNSATIMSAGFASGLFGTTSGIGGPALGLLYQHETGPEIRAMVGTVSLTAVVTTLGALALVGELSAVDLRTGLAFMPFSAAGAVSARYVTRWVDGRIRSIVQAISVVGAVLAIAKLAL